MKEKKQGYTKKYLIMPDSFKGTMSAATVCECIENSINKISPAADVKCIPVADGGEGTVECLLRALNGEKRRLKVKGPYGNTTVGYYGSFKDFAVVEMAVVAPFSTEKNRNPSIATTYGVGQLIKQAIEDGHKKIILGTGGSGTNDGGAGMVSAMGVVFTDDNGKEFIPTGGNLKNIKHIDTSRLDSLIKGVQIQVMSDVDNELYGPKGAAYVFAGQKGADSEMIEELDINLKYYSNIIESELGKSVAHVPGAGTAGGMGAGASAFLDARISPGIDVILDLVDFDSMAKNYDFIFTGEGKLDRQSLRGKVVIGIARRAKRISLPVIAVVGAVEGHLDDYLAEGLEDIWQIMPPEGYGENPDYEGQLRKTVLDHLQQNKRHF